MRHSVLYLRQGGGGGYVAGVGGETLRPLLGQPDHVVSAVEQLAPHRLIQLGLYLDGPTDVLQIVWFLIARDLDRLPLLVLGSGLSQLDPTEPFDLPNWQLSGKLCSVIVV